MIAAFVGVTVVYLLALALLARSFTTTLVNAIGDVTRAAEDERDRLLTSIDSERREWTTERQLLLTRIQDPTAGVASSLAYLPAPGDMDMDVER